MFTLTELYVGNADASDRFFDWCEQYARMERGWMSVTRVTLDPAYTAEPGVYLSDRERAYVAFLAENDLTDGVLITHYQYDDEVDLPQDAAQFLGLHRQREPIGREDRTELPRLEGTNALIADGYSFRLEAWKPIATVHGDDDGPTDLVHGIFPKPRGKRSKRPTSRF